MPTLPLTLRQPRFAERFPRPTPARRKSTRRANLSRNPAITYLLRSGCANASLMHKSRHGYASTYVDFIDIKANGKTASRTRASGVGSGEPRASAPWVRVGDEPRPEAGCQQRAATLDRLNRGAVEHHDE